MKKHNQEIISVSDVADGNPSTAYSLAEQLRFCGGNPTEIHLSSTALPVNLFHKDISSDPDSAKLYTSESESKRVGIKARLYAAACFTEMAVRLSFDRTHNTKESSRLNIVQEHQLLGASDAVIDLLGIISIRLAIPDVFPKESAKHAASRIYDTTFSVWNAEAQRELEDSGFKAELHKPYLLDGFRPNNPEFMNQGAEVVVKTSGNGMPKIWQTELLEELSQSRLGWSFHSPKGSIDYASWENSRLNKKDRIQNFYDDIGGNTKVIIGYSSELVGLVCDLRERGVDTWMITLTPRGAHELRNLEFAIRHNLVLGELAPTGYFHPPSSSGLRTIPMKMIQQVLSSAPEPTWQSGIVGTTPFWADAS